MSKFIAFPVEGITGETVIPGDKSISHRALILGAMAAGETVISGLLEGEDVLRTADALSAMGVAVDRGTDDIWRVHGVGVGGLAQPDDVLDLGNSGTGARLLMGLIASHPISVQMTGDASLRRRPMGRVSTPIAQMGARVTATDGDRLPLTLVGAEDPMPIEYALPVPSAQVKSAILLAGLNTAGTTTVIEDRPSRDHTELMLRKFGADIVVAETDEGGRRIDLCGQPELSPQEITVPGDPSSAAFAVVAALITPDSAITVRNVGMNPLRCGLYDVLIEMGANIKFENTRTQAGEPVADLVVSTSALKGITVPGSRAPSMIDEYPILAVAAAAAAGETRMEGLEELRVKESDRLAAIWNGLNQCGVKNVIEDDSLTVTGCNGRIPGGGLIETHLDHRIAMAFLVAGMAAEKPVTVDDDSAIATSFPDFVPLMTALGADFRAGDEE